MPRPAHPPAPGPHERAPGKARPPRPHPAPAPHPQAPRKPRPPSVRLRAPPGNPPGPTRHSSHPPASPSQPSLDHLPPRPHPHRSRPGRHHPADPHPRLAVPEPGRPDVEPAPGRGRRRLRSNHRQRRLRPGRLERSGDLARKRRHAGAREQTPLRRHHADRRHRLHPRDRPGHRRHLRRRRHLERHPGAAPPRGLQPQRPARASSPRRWTRRARTRKRSSSAARSTSTAATSCSGSAATTATARSTAARSSPLPRAAARPPTGRSPSAPSRPGAARSGPRPDRPSTRAGTSTSSTGNPNPASGKEATEFDDSDAVLSLNSALQLTGHFEPPTWRADSNSDKDLGSAAPELLPGGLVFQAGKTGTGYLIDEATHVRVAPPRSTATRSATARAASAATPTRPGSSTCRAPTARWRSPTTPRRAPSRRSGRDPPTPAARRSSPPALVWTQATGICGGGGTKLYGLDPGTGKPRYTLTLPSPITDHFGSPSAAGGRLYAATGSTITAYQTAMLTPLESPLAAVPRGTGAKPGDPAQKATLPLLVTSLRAGRHGLVKLRLRCPAGPHVPRVGHAPRSFHPPRARPRPDRPHHDRPRHVRGAPRHLHSRGQAEPHRPRAAAQAPPSPAGERHSRALRRRDAQHGRRPSRLNARARP